MRLARLRDTVDGMRTLWILLAGLALSVLLSLLFHGIYFLFIPLVFLPVAIGRRGREDDA